MTYSEYYSNKSRGQTNIYQYKQRLMQDITSRLMDSPNKVECNTLQQYLQDIFYPTTDAGQEMAQIYNSMITQIYEQEGRKSLKNFNIGDRNYNYTLDGVGNIARERFESFEHKTYIEMATIEQRLEKVKQALLQVKSVKEMPKLQKQLTELKKMLERLQGIKTDNKGRIYLTKDKSLYQQVQQMDNLYQILSKDTIISPKDYGDILEYALNAMNEPVDDIKQGVTSELIKKITKTAGSVVTGGNGTTIKLDNSYAPKTKNKMIRIGKGRGASFTFKYEPQFNPNSERQGKMDVELKLPQIGTSKPFRISAKNWGTLKDLGETSLVYALIRSLGKEQTLEYTYILQDRDNNQQQLTQAHQLAKLAIVADILMGYSQTTQWADTLVINHRAKRQVIVQPMLDIFKSLEENLNKLSIKGYREGVIQRNLLALSRSANWNDKYFQIMSLKYLQSIHVTLLYNSLIKI